MKGFETSGFTKLSLCCALSPLISFPGFKDTEDVTFLACKKL